MQSNSDMGRNSGHYGYFGLIAVVGILAFLSTGSADPDRPIETTEEQIEETHALQPARHIRAHLKVRDTLFTTDSVYLDTDLSKQSVTLRFRSGRTRTFLISSGNPNIREGISTPTGIFTVQSKLPLAISRQFDDAKLHNWIGVYGGVGFHGLDGNGYYWNLGKRPSSHGCIRMAREEIKKMYEMVHVGAPIIVHEGEPARVIAFCDPDDTLDADVIDTARAKTRGLGKERMKALYAGDFFMKPTPRLVHLAGTRVSWHIDAGLRSRIPRQNIPGTLPLPTLAETIGAGIRPIDDYIRTD